MAKPITPRMAIDTVANQQLSINFNQTWDGVSWVITAAGVKLNCLGNLSSAGNAAAGAEIQLLGTDLPPAGQQALIDLLNFIEDEMVAKYNA